MSSSLLRALRARLSRRYQVTHSGARRLLRLRVETLESRLLLHGAGTLSDEHEAVMRLIEFEEIHRSASAPVYYVAQDGDLSSPADVLWSDVRNWLTRTFDPATNTFVTASAVHVPANGDDVRIPVDVSMVYDLSPAAFQTFVVPPIDTTATASVKNNLRLHTVGVEGSLTFKPNADLLMYFETMVVATTGSLTITEDAAHTVRLVIAAPDWSQFSLAQPFDTNLDPLEFARGMISHGTVNMSGENVTPYITLPQLTRKDNNVVPPRTTTTVGASTAPADPGSFKFTAPAGTATAGWTVGDRIVVTGTDPNKVN